MLDVPTAVLGISAVIAVASISVIVVRVASALAQRLETRPADAAPPDPVSGELRHELDAIQERLDFLERALVAQKGQSGRVLPAQREPLDAPAHTPS